MISLKSNKVKGSMVSAVCISALFLVALLFSFTARSQFLTPANAYTDSSVFQYVARVMLNGGTPYLDTFDHKGPLIYVINTFALWLSPDKGLWIVELVVLFISFFLMYRLSRIFCNKITSVFVVIAIIPILKQFFDGGNLTEEYALPCIAGALYIFCDFFVNKKITWLRLFLCGALFGAILMLRVNMIAVWIVMCLGVLAHCIYHKSYKQLLYFLGYFMLGFLVAVLPFIIWLALRGALKSFFNDYILFNFTYSADEQRANIYSKTFSYLRFLYEPLVMVSLGVMCVALFKKKTLLSALWIGCLLLTLLLTCISGQQYAHYGMILVPVIIIPLAYIGKACENDFNKNRLGSVFLIAYLLVSLVLPTWQTLTNNAINSYRSRGTDKTEPSVIAVSSWVEKNTEADEQIIVCGNLNVIYNESNRFAASRYSYQAPICKINSDMENDFFEEISKNKPAAIVLPTSFYAYDKMVEFIETHNYLRVYDDNVGDKIELYIPA